MSQPAVPSPSPRRISYAQNGEDILLDRLLGDHRDGRYIDVGSCHPLRCSNTAFFHERGWRGVNIEPTPAGHALFQAARPADLNLALAVSDHDGELTLFEILDEPGNSTLDPALAAQYRNQGRPIAERAVPVRTLASLIEAHGLTPPDLLSIDVEGHEAAVLRGAPLDRWQPAVLLIESTLPWSTEPTHAEWEPLLLERGYQFAAFNGVNRVYLRGDLADRAHRLAIPVNSLDHFERHETVEQRERADQIEARLSWELDQAAAARAQHEALRQAWEWGRTYTRYAEAIWKQECDATQAERAALAAERARFEREQAAWTAERAALATERDNLARALHDHQALLHSAQRDLRPYRLIDRMGLVSTSYTLARRLRD